VGGDYKNSGTVHLKRTGDKKRADRIERRRCKTKKKICEEGKQGPKPMRAAQKKQSHPHQNPHSPQRKKGRNNRRGIQKKKNIHKRNK